MSKVHVNPGDVDVATKVTWEEMFRGVPDKAWDLITTIAPEAIEAHRKLVQALLENGCNLDRAIPASTGGKFRFGYGGDKTVKYHRRLAEAVRQWANQRGL